MQKRPSQNGANSFKNVGFTRENTGFTREQAVKIPMIIALLSLTTMLTVPIILMWVNGAFRTI
jgi:hypothetical protein